MTLLHLKMLCIAALSVSFGLSAVCAQEKKPPVVTGDPKKPDGEKKPGVQYAGKVASVDPKANTITLVGKGDNERVVELTTGVKVFIDEKAGKLADIPKGSLTSFLTTPAMKGVPAEVLEIRVTGATVSGVIKQVDAATISLDNEKNPRTVAISGDTKVTVNGAAAKVNELKAGDKVILVLSTDEKSALSVASGQKKGDGNPGKNLSFGGKISAVNDKANTITVTTGKGDVTETVVKLTADAKIVVDGKAVKLADLPKGMFATFTILPAKEGAPREASAVTVSGPTLGGTVKKVDATSITLDNVKSGERSYKLLPTTAVTINGKEAKIADLKDGDQVTITMMSDDSGALSITCGKAPEKPKQK